VDCVLDRQRHEDSTALIATHAMLSTQPLSTQPLSYPPAGKATDVVQEVLSTATGLTISKPSNTIFSSSKGAPFVRGYHGIQEGSLYLLGAGVLFIKPVIFLPVSAIDSVLAGRGGSATTRYIDLKIDTEAGDSYEFSNLDRDELASIQVSPPPLPSFIVQCFYYN
jgi:hypothetical protein